MITDVYKSTNCCKMEIIKFSRTPQNLPSNAALHNSWKRVVARKNKIQTLMRGLPVLRKINLLARGKRCFHLNGPFALPSPHTQRKEQERIHFPGKQCRQRAPGAADLPDDKTGVPFVPTSLGCASPSCQTYPMVIKVRTRCASRCSR